MLDVWGHRTGSQSFHPKDWLTLAIYVTWSHSRKRHRALLWGQQPYTVTVVHQPQEAQCLSDPDERAIVHSLGRALESQGRYKTTVSQKPPQSVGILIHEKQPLLHPHLPCGILFSPLGLKINLFPPALTVLSLKRMLIILPNPKWVLFFYWSKVDV